MSVLSVQSVCLFCLSICLVSGCLVRVCLSYELEPEPPFTGPSGPEIAKKLKKVFWGGGLQKSPKKSREKSKQTDFRIFSCIIRCFRVCLVTFLQTPQKTFLEFSFRDFGPGAPGDSCKWQLGSQLMSASSCLWSVFTKGV